MGSGIRDQRSAKARNKKLAWNNVPSEGFFYRYPVLLHRRIDRLLYHRFDLVLQDLALGRVETSLNELHCCFVQSKWGCCHRSTKSIRDRIGSLTFAIFVSACVGCSRDILIRNHVIMAPVLSLEPQRTTSTSCDPLRPRTGHTT